MPLPVSAAAARRVSASAAVLKQQRHQPHCCEAWRARSNEDAPTMTSPPPRISGTASACTGVGSVQPRPSHARMSSGLTPSSSNADMTPLTVGDSAPACALQGQMTCHRPSTGRLSTCRALDVCSVVSFDLSLRSGCPVQPVTRAPSPKPASRRRGVQPCFPGDA